MPLKELRAFKLLELPVPANLVADSIYFIQNDAEKIREIYITDSSKNPIRYSRDFSQSSLFIYMTDSQTVPTTFGLPNYSTPTLNRGLVNWDSTNKIFSFASGLVGEIFSLNVATLYKGTITGDITGFIQLQARYSGGSWSTIFNSKTVAARGSTSTIGSVSLNTTYVIGAAAEFRVLIRCTEEVSTDSVEIDTLGSFLSVNVLKS